MSINFGMPIGTAGGSWYWQVGLPLLAAFALGLFIAICTRKAYYWRFALRFFPEVAEYPNPKLGRRAFYRALGNWQTTMLSISLWVILVAAVLAYGISLVHVLILWLLCAWSYVVVPLATRDIIRERLRRGLPGHDDSAPQVETGVQ